MTDKKLTDISVHLMTEESRFGASKVYPFGVSNTPVRTDEAIELPVTPVELDGYKPETVTIGTKPKKGVITNVSGEEVTPTFDTENYGVIIIDEPEPVLMMGTNRVGKSSMNQTILDCLKDMTGGEPVVIVTNEPCRASDDVERMVKRAEERSLRYVTTIRARAHNDAILATLTEALGSYVISVLRQYPERAAEYLRNWHTECRIYHDRCVVTRRGEVIAEGVF